MEEFVFRRHVLALVSALCVAAFGLAGAAQAQESAEAFIRDLGDRTLEILADEDMDRDAKRAALGSIFTEGLNIPTIGAFVMGRYWRQMDEDQQIAYLQKVQDFIVTTYSRRFLDFDGQEFMVLGQRPEGDDALVTSRIVQPDGAAIDVGWRVRTYEDGRYQVIDVIVEELSQLRTWRDEFSSIIQRNGGDVMSVMDELDAGIARQQG